MKTSEAKITAALPAIDMGWHLPLPQLAQGFYGRRREYRQLREGLLQRNQRAVIIHGIGGIGKTALVSHAATRLRKRFRGVYAFDCGGGTLVPERVITELHRYFELQDIHALQRMVFQPLPPEVLAGFLAQVLSQWPLLVIFDNFETQLERTDDDFHIADEALRIFLTTLVKATATGSRFLFTSRYLFDVDDKRLGNIQSLPLGDLSRSEALMMMQKLPHLAVATHGEKLAAYQTFGGHPYALVALDRHCNFRKLSDTLDDARALHTELREFLAIEINYARLSNDARELLNRLSAFRQAVPFAAADWVMGEKVSYAAEVLQQQDRSSWPDQAKAISDTELLAMLEQQLPERRQWPDLMRSITELIEWSLLTPLVEEGQLEAISVHNLVRDFCRRQQAGERWRTFLRDAATFYMNQTKLLGEYDKKEVAVWGEMEAFELLMEAEDFADTSVLLRKVHPILHRWGYGRYLESQYHRLLDKLDQRGVASARHNLGMLLQERGDYDAALYQYRLALKIREELGDYADVSASLFQIGRINQARGDYDAALHQYQLVLKTFETLNNRAGIANSLHEIAIIHHDRGHYDEALKYYQISLKIAEELGDRDHISSSLHQIGMIHHIRGNHDAAMHQYHLSLKIREELGDRKGIALLAGQIGMIHHDRGDYEAALQQYQLSLKMLEELGDRPCVAGWLHNLGVLLYDRGDYEAALQQHQLSLKIRKELGDRAGVAGSLAQIGKLFTKTGGYAEAFQYLLSALSTFVNLQSPNARIVFNDLKTLRAKWGAQGFDVAWQQAMGKDVPERLTQ